MKDENTIAYQVLRKALGHHVLREKARLIEYRKTWAAAKVAVRSIPSRQELRRNGLTPDQIAKIGRIEGL